jgi:hypothetical protein
MNRTLAGVCTAVLMSAAVLGAQSKATEGGSKSSDNGKSGAAANTGVVVFTGCLPPKANADAFYLTGAKQKGVKGEATTVKLVPADKKVDLDSHVTQEIEVTGTLDKAGATPTLTVTKVKTRDDRC